MIVILIHRLGFLQEIWVNTGRVLFLIPPSMILVVVALFLIVAMFFLQLEYMGQMMNPIIQLQQMMPT